MSRDRVLCVRFTEAERAAIIARAERDGVKPSDVVRRAVAAVTDPPTPTPTPKTYTMSGLTPYPWSWT